MISTFTSPRDIDRTYSTHGLELGRSLVLKVVGVLNLPWGPDTLVSWVVDEGRTPFALVVWILLHGWFPFSAAGHLVAFGVRYGRRDPVTVLFIIPIFRLLGLWVWNSGRLVLKPVFGLRSFLIDNLEWRFLIPIFRLLGLRVWDTSLVDPIIWFLVLGVINFLFRIDRWGEIFKEGAVAE